jgi:hypothetical protein
MNKSLPLKPYSDEELRLSDEMKEKVEKEMQLLDEYGIDYGKFDFEMPKLKLKKSYPNYDAYMPAQGRHDLEKWMQAVKNIYFQEKNGMDRREAVRRSTSNWKITETFDFLNWLKFYEGKNHMKYKTAQLWYENPSVPGYFLHVKPDQNKINDSMIQPNSIDQAQNAMVDELPVAEKKRIIERQRHKIIGRLDSAEKLLRSTEGHMFAGKDLEALMDIIYSLKKKIQLVNKLSSSTRLYEDMIVREGNVLYKNGFIKSADFIYSLAQEMPVPATPQPPNQAMGTPGGLPAMGPGMPQNPPESAPNDGSAAALNQSSPQQAAIEVAIPPPISSKGINDFLERMESGNFTEVDEKTDKQQAEDILEVSDSNESFVVEAQEAPEQDLVVPPTASTPTDQAMPDPAQTENELVVSDGDSTKNTHTSQNFDSVLDSALSNISVEDVISKLEIVSQICSVRELSRQLAFVDIMLNKLNMGVFTELSEAQTKALDSNNYVKTRVDEMLGKIRGSLSSHVSLTGNPNNVSPDPRSEQIKNKVLSDDEKEQNRKQRRKELENQESDVAQNQAQKETPNVEIDEGLTPPAPEVAPPQIATPQPPKAQPLVPQPAG